MAHASADVRAALKRMLSNGPLTHLPGRDDDLEMILALAASRFEPSRSYCEGEINEILASWLETFSLPSGVDHVTVRRCLVDAGYLVRDKAGSAYRLSMQVAELIEGPDDAIEPARILEEVRLDRETRKRARTA
jgi:hypothetical protein